MFDRIKVKHILKGIVNHAFHLLVFRNSGSVKAVVSEYRRFEQTKSHQRPPNYQ